MQTPDETERASILLELLSAGSYQLSADVSVDTLSQCCPVSSCPLCSAIVFGSCAQCYAYNCEHVGEHYVLYYVYLFRFSIFRVFMLPPIFRWALEYVHACVTGQRHHPTGLQSTSSSILASITLCFV